MSRGPGTIQKKIILLLLGGLALGLSGSPRRYFKILNAIGREWEAIDRRALHGAIKRLYQSKLVDEKSNPDGSLTLVLSEEGKERALTYKIEDLKINRPPIWDKKWRVVIFDIPERDKKIRDSLRYHLRNLGFIELQKSVFVIPFTCTDEIEFLIELYNIRSYVRQLLCEHVDNELHLKKKFGLS